MLKQEKHSESIVNLIEQMMDIRFTMMAEKQYNNYRQFFHIKETQYDPIVKELIVKLDQIEVDFNSGKR
jgi:hypothetical protein